MSWLELALTGVGLVLVVLVARDVMHTLVHPGGRGDVSSFVLRHGWRLGRWACRRRPDKLARVGPVLVLLVIGAWAVLLIAGWALLYWPHLPHAFTFATGIPLAQREGFATALYYSAVCLSTVGYGDITPLTTPMRLVSATQSVVGFGLLTASISWIISLFPVLTRQRSLAEEALLLRRREQEDGRSVLELADGAADVLARLTAHMVTAESDVVHFSASYYFSERETRASLAAALPYLLDLARQAAAPTRPDAVRYHARLLQRAIDDFALALSEHFLRLPAAAATTEAVLAAYAADHLRAPATRR